MIVLPDGDFLHFRRISRGGGYADAVYQHSETSSRFYGALTSWTGNGWETRLADGSRIRFPESYNAQNMARGAPTQILEPNGNTVLLIRDAQRNLKEIRTSEGHWIKLLYDDQARVVRAEDHEQHWVTYGYNTDGMLVDVKHSDGSARRYSYVGDLLTWVRDETGRVLIHNWYRNSRVVRQDYSNGDTYRIDYHVTGNNHYADDATVVLSTGSIRSFRTDASVAQSLKLP